MISQTVEYDPRIPPGCSIDSNIQFSGCSLTTGTNVFGSVGIPFGYNVVGTCGSCGGPLLNPQQICGNYVPDVYCQHCGKKAKYVVQPIYGPIREME